MSLEPAEWETAEPADDVLTSVHEVLVEGAPQAYCVADFFRDAAPSEPEPFELIDRLLEAIEWRTSRERSEAIVEMSLETLAYEGRVDKRIAVVDGESVAYYRAA